MATALPPAAAFQPTMVSHDPTPDLTSAEERAVRREIASALSGRGTPATSADMHAAFVKGAKVIEDLRRKQQLNEADAEVLLKCLTTLFVRAQVSDMMHHLFDDRASSPVFRWLTESTR